MHVLDLPLLQSLSCGPKRMNFVVRVGQAKTCVAQTAVGNIDWLAPSNNEASGRSSLFCSHASKVMT